MEAAEFSARMRYSVNCAGVEAADREFHCSEFEGNPSVELCVRLRDRQMFFTDLVRAGS